MAVDKRSTEKQGAKIHSLYGTEIDTRIVYQAQPPLSEIKKMIWYKEEPGI